jgi:hypothetical protein
VPVNHGNNLPHRRVDELSWWNAPSVALRTAVDE